MRKFYFKVFAVSLITLAIFVVIFWGVYLGIKGTFDDNYQKGFVYQYRALQNADTNENKIIVIGGSHMTFATDSAQLGELTQMPVYTLGVNSGMGMDYIFEIAEQFANEGDIIVFSFSPFEANAYGMDLINITLDGESDMFWDFFFNHPGEIIKSAGSAVYTKIYGMAKMDDLLKNIKNNGEETVYVAEAFDEKTGNLIYRLREFEIEPIVSDSWADAAVAKQEYDVELVPFEEITEADCVIVAVDHTEYRSMSTMKLKELFKKNTPDGEKVLIDVKSLYRKDELDASGMRYWRL